MGADPSIPQAEVACHDTARERFDAHCKRVAAWTVELARSRGLNVEQQDNLERAALTHHSLLATLRGPGRAAFLGDLGIEELDPETTPRVHHEILEIANALDEHFEWEPFADRAKDEPNPAASAALECLLCVNEEDLQQAISKLPVFPVAAQQALDLLARGDWNAYDLRVIAASDQVLAADLIRSANSWAYGPRQAIKTLPHAITYIGADQASKILLAAAIKPLFGTPALREIWNHSIEASEAAQGLAKLSGRANPEEAFLAGLVHDIGRLAMALLPDVFQHRSAQLLKKGCELMLVEKVLCGSSHAELGAKALEQWSFPPKLIEAVRFHHEPEQSDSALTSILYLAERWTNPWEDLPSSARSKTALERLGIQTETLDDRDMRMQSSLNSLRFTT
jgi:putative nucleotidyltransferase with HDIG domain